MSFKVGMKSINHELLTKALESEVREEISDVNDSVQTTSTQTTFAKTKNSSAEAFAERNGIDLSGLLQKELLVRTSISSPTNPFKTPPVTSLLTVPDILELEPRGSITPSENPFKAPRLESSIKVSDIVDEVGPTIFAPGFDSIATEDELGVVIGGEGNGGVKPSNDQSDPYEPHKQEPPQDNSDVTGPVDTTNGVDLDKDGYLRPADDGGMIGPTWMGNREARQHIKIPGLGGLDDSSDPNPDGVGGTDHKPNKGQPSGNGSTTNDDGNDNGSNNVRDQDNWSVLGPYVRPQELSGEVLKTVTAKIKNK